MPRGTTFQISSLVATRGVFFCLGFLCAVWAAAIPSVKSQYGVDEAELGRLLLCLGSGSLVAMPLTGMLVRRFGCRCLIGVCYAGAAMALCGVLWMPDVWTAAGMIAFMGATIGITDVTMNMQAVAVEQQLARPVLSVTHALYSVGCMIGAASASALLHAGCSVTLMMTSLGITLMGILATLLPGCLVCVDDQDENEVSHGSGITLCVFLIGAGCFVLYLSEGAIMDWGGVYMRDVAKSAAEDVALGFVAFNAGMTLCRLTGDRLVQVFGEMRVVAVSGIAVTLGSALLTQGLAVVCTLAAFFLMGLGAANLIPVMYRMIGRQGAMTVSSATAAVSTMGYLGILAGPAIIGFVANAIGLTKAFGMIAATLAVVTGSMFLVLARR